MVRYLANSVAVLMVMVIAAPALAADPPATAPPAAPGRLVDENVMTPLPEGFQVARQARDGPTIIAEYVPAGETVADWSRMVTVQVLQNLKGVDPDDFARGIESTWEAACAGADVRKLEDGQERGYGYSLWQFNCPLNTQAGKPENSTIKLIKGQDALYVVQYALRSALTRENAAPMTAYLASVWVCDTRRADRACPTTAP